MTRDITIIPPIRSKLSEHKGRSLLKSDGSMIGKYQLLAQYMVFGVDEAMARRFGLPANAPLSMEQVRGLLGLRLREARSAMGMAEFQTLMSKMTHELKFGERAKSIATLAEVRDTQGEGSAADRKVRIDAAAKLLDEPSVGGGSSRGPNINIGIMGGGGSQGRGGRVNAYGEAIMPTGIIIELSLDRDCSREDRIWTAKEIRRWPTENAAGCVTRIPDEGHVDGESPWHFCLLSWPDGRPEEAAYRPEPRLTVEEKTDGARLMVIEQNYRQKDDAA